jgi:hypothetical protein
MPILGLFDAAERPPCRRPGVVGNHPTTAVLLFEHCQMGGDLAGKVRFGPPRQRRVQEPREPPAQRRDHGDSPTRSLFTRPARRRQRSVCVWRARLPALVMA